MKQEYSRYKRMKKRDKGQKIDLRKVTPASRNYGYDRGTPIDRYYIEKFLRKNEFYIQGTVLEVQDRGYTSRFGGSKVHYSDVLDINTANKMATIYADLRDRRALPKEKYDCIILTQVLQYIDKYDLVISNLHRMLKKRGVVLCTIPSVSCIDPCVGEEGDFWRFTKASACYIFKKHFAEDKLQIEAYGNVFVDICFLEGVSAEEITRKELDHYDNLFPLIICVRAIK